MCAIHIENRLGETGEWHIFMKNKISMIMLLLIIIPLASCGDSQTDALVIEQQVVEEAPVEYTTATVEETTEETLIDIVMDEDDMAIDETSEPAGTANAAGCPNLIRVDNGAKWVGSSPNTYTHNLDYYIYGK